MTSNENTAYYWEFGFVGEEVGVPYPDPIEDHANSLGMGDAFEKGENAVKDFIRWFADEVDGDPSHRQGLEEAAARALETGEFVQVPYTGLFSEGTITIKVLLFTYGPDGTTQPH